MQRTEIEARYLDAAIRTKIARDRRAGTKLWRIARDVGQTVEVVREVLRQKGFAVWMKNI